MSKIICLFLFLFCFSISNAQNSDIDLLEKINLNRNTNIEPLMKGVTNSTFAISIGTPVIIYAVGLIEKDSTTKKKAVFVGETLAASAFITLVLKNSIKRDRPYVTYPEIDNVTNESSYSFPSGHTSAAFATATSLSMAYPKWYVIAPSFLWAGAVGYSRMYLGVHYPTDVLAGAIVGSGSAFLCYKLNKWINKKRAPHQKKLWE
ncbi:phosphatase PAP2 family protein [Flavobacterium sp. 5]|uniref:phosphatase PAP2 family protein n=1 Tax=Flavobacterium sp. 5 TaxID=2035199 RepID=UPI000C2B92C5|nr:phosphatase PAP2 family protein [Flavobacterium sp. 5]PKB18956.1 membrane-associated phospholipid phosphatase [Flavobacterium sp. 5]